MPENDDMADDDVVVTRGYLRREFEAWAKHILEATERAAEAREQRLWVRLDSRFERVFAEIAQHAKATQEYVATRIKAVDEKYQDLPERVARLERRRRR